MPQVSYSFPGMNFVITGAASGIGKKISEELLTAGATVLGIDRTAEPLNQLAASNPNFVAGHCDVRDADNMKVIIDGFAAARGRINGAVHSAGIMIASPLVNYDEQQAREIMDISFWAGVRLIRIVHRKKVVAPKAASVLISSIAAYGGDKSNFAYSGTKAAIQTAVRSIAKEIIAVGARINSVSPGWVRTSMTKENLESNLIPKRLLERSFLGIGETEDVSGIVLFLLSDRARWVTGQDFVVDGGYLIG